MDVTIPVMKRLDLGHLYYKIEVLGLFLFIIVTCASSLHMPSYLFMRLHIQLQVRGQSALQVGTDPVLDVVIQSRLVHVDD